MNELGKKSVAEVFHTKQTACNRHRGKKGLIRLLQKRMKGEGWRRDEAGEGDQGWIMVDPWEKF